MTFTNLDRVRRLETLLDKPRRLALVRGLRIAELEAELKLADEMDDALEWMDSGHVVRSADKLSRLDTAQRVYREKRAERGTK